MYSTIQNHMCVRVFVHVDVCYDGRILLVVTTSTYECDVRLFFSCRRPFLKPNTFLSRSQQFEAFCSSSYRFAALAHTLTHIQSVECICALDRIALCHFLSKIILKRCVYTTFQHLKPYSVYSSHFHSFIVWSCCRSY